MLLPLLSLAGSKPTDSVFYTVLLVPARVAMANSADPTPAQLEQKSPPMELLNTLVTTGVVMGIGSLAVQFRILEPARGDMLALRWYVGKVARPLLIFKVVATSDVGGVQWYFIVSCALAKISIMIIVWLLAFFCYHSHSTAVRQRVLTATCFAFFVVASDDIAVGLPVVRAIYSAELGIDLYLAANTLITAAVFTPVVMVLCEIGKAMTDSLEHVDVEHEPSDSQALTQEVTLSEDVAIDVQSPAKILFQQAPANNESSTYIAKSIILHPVIVGVLAGVSYKTLLGNELGAIGGKVIDELTAPFGMMALFAIGTVIKPPSVSLWPVVLSTFKVLVCAFLSFSFARWLAPSSAPDDVSLIDFSFFYGSIPTGSMPLLFTMDNNPAVVESVASATLFGLFLAGPVMLATTMFQESEGHVVDPVVLQTMQLYVSFCSFVLGCVCLALFIVLAVRGRWGPVTMGKVCLAVYGAVGCMCAFFAWRVSFERCPPAGIVSLDCPNYFMVAWLGRSRRWIMVVMQALTIPWSCGEFHVSFWHEAVAVSAVLAASLASAFHNPEARPVNMQCKMQVSDEAYFFREVSASVSFVLLVGMEGYRLKMRTHGRRASGDSPLNLGEMEPLESQEEEWPHTCPTRVVRALVFWHVLQRVCALSDSAAQWAGWKVKGSFISMLMLEGLLENGGSGFLFVVLLSTKSFVKEVRLFLSRAPHSRLRRLRTEHLEL